MVAIETRDIEGSGRGLVAVTPIAAGELVLRESPVLLTVTQDLHKAVCAHCLRYIQGNNFPQEFSLQQGLSNQELTLVECWEYLQAQRYSVKSACKLPSAMSSASN